MNYTFLADTFHHSKEEVEVFLIFVDPFLPANTLSYGDLGSDTLDLFPVLNFVLARTAASPA